MARRPRQPDDTPSQADLPDLSDTSSRAEPSSPFTTPQPPHGTDGFNDRTIDNAIDSSVLSFPLLDSDGSLSSPSKFTNTHSKRLSTPPAALSTAGIRAKMAEEDTMSQSSFADSQYDMVDDASELSNDDRETASLLSSDEGQGQMTPEIQHGYDERGDEFRGLRTPSPTPGPIDTEHGAESLSEDAIQSFLTDDMETPRQSTLAAFTQSLSSYAKEPATEPEIQKLSKVPREEKSWSALMIPQGRNTVLLLGFLTAFLVMSASYDFLMPHSTVTEVTMRRENLAAILPVYTNSTETAKLFNVEQLLPLPDQTGTDMSGVPFSGDQNVLFQAIQPNHVVVSLPKKVPVIWDYYYPVPTHIKVSRGTSDIKFTTWKLIDGFYDIVLDAPEAYGQILVQMVTKEPFHNISAQYDFGNRLLHRETYEKIGTDISKTVTKDLTVARHAAKVLTDLLQVELSAGMRATKNVTTQLALYAARDVQLFKSSTMNMLGKINNASNHAALVAKRDLAKLGKDFILISEGIQKSIKSQLHRANPSSTLLLARSRAQKLNAKLTARRNLEEDVSSASKALSVRIQDFSLSVRESFNSYIAAYTKGAKCCKNKSECKRAKLSARLAAKNSKKGGCGMKKHAKAHVESGKGATGETSSQ